MYQSTYVYNSYTEQPSANICVGKNRLKQYSSNVYLKNNQEFEIELFNPKTTPILAKIKLNGSYISTKGIYLKPGERVFLNRFIDKAMKFTFSTYEVDGDNSSVLKAIANNGDVSVEFYDEQVVFNTTWNQPYWAGGSTLGSTFTYTNNTVTDNLNTVNNYYSNTSSASFNSSPKLKRSLRSQSLETGRIEGGSSSNQKFETINGNFNNWYTTVVNWKILSESQEPVTVASVTTNYCGACGTKIQKSNYNFCPNCGEKL